MVLAAVTQSGNAIRYAHRTLWDDRDVMLAAVAHSGHYLIWATRTNRLTTQKDVVLAAVKNDGWALQHASKEMRADKEVVLEAVINDPLGECKTALGFASKSLQADPLLNRIASVIPKNPLRFLHPWLAKRDLDVAKVQALRVDAFRRLYAEYLNYVVSPDFDPVLDRSRRATRRWCVLRVRVKIWSFAWWYVETRAAATHAAHFSAKGKAVLTGRAARVAKRDWTSMMA